MATAYKNEALRCRSLKELMYILENQKIKFEAIPERVTEIKREILEGQCVFPPILACEKDTGFCTITDGRHRIIVSNLLGKKTMLVREIWE